MTRRRTRIIRAVFFTALLLVIVRVAHHRMENTSANFAAPASAAPDAAAAMRSITGSTHPLKPWAADLAGFTADHPGHWLVGRCAGPCLSQTEAQQSARADAAKSLCNLALNRHGFSRTDQRWLAERLQKAVQAGNFASDDQLEHFDRPYGTIWTDSVLLNASPEKVEGLLAQYQTELHARNIRRKGIVLAAVGIGMFTWLAYLLCNAITRGYFSLRLQIIAGTITAIALLVLIGGP